MNHFWLAIAAVLCNVGAQVATKFAGHKIVSASGWLAWFNVELLVAICLYTFAFLFTVRVFAVNCIIVAGPIMAGATFVLVGLAGVIIFSEFLSSQRIVGMAFILAGIILVTRSA